MSDRLCNYCLVREAIRNAQRQYRKIPTVEKISDPEKGFPEGVRVLVEGKSIGWFAKLTAECTC